MLSMETGDPAGTALGLVVKSTHPFSGMGAVPEHHRGRLESGVLHVLGMCLFGGGAGQAWLLALCAAAALLSWRGGLFPRDGRLPALLAVTAVSLAGPLSWFVLAKGHSHHHPNLNAVLWYLPSNFLVYAFLARAASLLPGSAFPGSALPGSAFRGGGAAWLMKKMRFLVRR